MIRSRSSWLLVWLLPVCWIVLFASACGEDGRASNEPALPSVDSTGRPGSAPTRLRVKAAEARLESFAHAGNVTGTVRAFYRASVTAETQGRVVARVAQPGAEVAKGDVLVELDATRLAIELRRAKAALRSARTVREHAQREFERGELLASEGAISAQRRDDLRLAIDRAKNEFELAAVARDTAQRNLEDTRIVAPFDGVVDSIAVDAGDFVSPGAAVATVVDFSRVRVFGGVTAKEAARLETGALAKVSFADLGGRTFDATLKHVSRVADASDGTYEIELWLDGNSLASDTLMRDGLVARIQLPNAAGEQVLLAPRAALLRRDGRPEIFVLESNGRRKIARARLVETGRSDGDWIEVVTGLEEGESVIYEGQFALQDGSEVELDGLVLPATAKRE